MNVNMRSFITRRREIKLGQSQSMNQSQTDKTRRKY